MTTKTFRRMYFLDAAIAAKTQQLLRLEGIETEIVLIANADHGYISALVLSRAARLQARRSHYMLRKFYLQHAPLLDTDRGTMRNYLTDHRMI